MYFSDKLLLIALDLILTNSPTKPVINKPLYALAFLKYPQTNFEHVIYLVWSFPKNFIDHNEVIFLIEYLFTYL